MRFPIDIVYIDKDGKVLKTAHSVPPFRICVAPLRAYYALELPAGSLASSSTRVKDILRFVEEYGTEEAPEPCRRQLRPTPRLVSRTSRLAGAFFVRVRLPGHDP